MTFIQLCWEKSYFFVGFFCVSLSEPVIMSVAFGMPLSDPAGLYVAEFRNGFRVGHVEIPVLGTSYLWSTFQVQSLWQS